jgi:hypothetical protein
MLYLSSPQRPASLVTARDTSVVIDSDIAHSKLGFGSSLAPGNHHLAPPHSNGDGSAGIILLPLL